MPVNSPSKHEMLTQCWSNSCPPSATLAHHQTSTGSMPRVCWAAGLARHTAGSEYKLTPIQFLVNWASIAGAGQYPFSPSQYFMLAVPACWRYRHDSLNQRWVNVGPPSVTLAHIQRGAKHDMITQYWVNVGVAS